MENECSTATLKGDPLATTLVLNESDSFHVDPSKNVNAIFTYCPPLLLAIGSVGNALTFCTMMTALRRASSHHSSMMVYLAALAVADTSTLWTWLSYYWSPLVLGASFPGLRGACNFHVWILYWSMSCSAFLVVALATDRYVIITFPLKAKIYLSRLRSTVVVCVIVVVCGAIHVPAIFALEPGPAPTCRPSNNTYLQSYSRHGRSIALMVSYAIMPDILILSLNIGTIYRLTKARLLHLSNAKTIQRTLRKTTYVTIGISFMFVACTLPQILGPSLRLADPSLPRIAYILDSEKTTLARGESTKNRFPLMSLVGILIVLTNHTLNFLLYVVVSSSFRKYLKSLFRCTNQDSLETPKQETAVRNVGNNTPQTASTSV